MTPLALFAAVFGLASAEPLREIPPAGPALAALGWLAGTWATAEDGVVTEEHWTVPRGGAMLGMNRVSTAEKMLFFETLRIEAHEDAVVYLASPAGSAPTPFQLTERGDRRAVFANPDHDFPQTITYERSGDTLAVRAVGITDGKPRTSTWTWHLVP